MITILPADLMPNVTSEFRKAVTMPRGRVLASTIGAVALIASIVATRIATPSGPPDPAARFATAPATIGLYAGLVTVVLAAACFGVLSGGAEYRYRTMAVTMLFAPDRDRFTAAKFLVTGCCALVAAAAVELITLAGSATVELLTSGTLFGVERDKITVTAELFGVLGGGLLTVVCWSLLGVGASILLRSSTGAFALLLGWGVLVEPLLWLLAHGFGIPGVATLLPLSATVATVAAGAFPDNDFLAPAPAAAVVLLLWTTGIGVASWWSLRTKDL
ncbi:ABC transporter permease [Nocardia sp. 004]|uniref:ABC transporter permease n=1 Tax=Nocardia sp. 004 TaxID=3385978 RepID=UPI0039A19AE2